MYIYVCYIFNISYYLPTPLSSLMILSLVCVVPQLQQEADLENDFIREYYKSQQALFRQQTQDTDPGELLLCCYNKYMLINNLEKLILQ